MKIKEIERLNIKLLELSELSRSKECALGGLVKEITSKTAEIQEFDEIITESDEKYQKVIKDNRETLEQIIKDLKQKEDEYHNLMVDIDKLAQQRSEITEHFENIENEAIVKEQQIKRFEDNLELAKEQFQQVHENILVLTEQESQFVRSKNY